MKTKILISLALLSFLLIIFINKNNYIITKYQSVVLRNTDLSIDSLLDKMIEKIKEKGIIDSITYSNYYDENGKVVKIDTFYNYKNWSFSGITKKHRHLGKINDLLVYWIGNEKNKFCAKEMYIYELTGSFGSYNKNGQTYIEPTKYEGQIVYSVNPRMIKGESISTDYAYFFSNRDSSIVIEKYSFGLGLKDLVITENPVSKYISTMKQFNLFKAKIINELKELN